MKVLLREKRNFSMKNGFGTSLYRVMREPALFELRIQGCVDHINAPHFEAVLDRALDLNYRHLILNCAEMTYASSAAWGVVAAAAQRFKSVKGNLSLAAMPEMVQESFRILQFHTVLDSFPTVLDAIAHYVLSFTGVVADVASLQKQLSVNTVAVALDANKPFVEPQNMDGPHPAGESAIVREKGGREKPDDAIPVADKIKSILMRYGPLSSGEIRKILAGEEYGKTKISIFRFRKILEELHLGTKTQIERFCRSA
jgi:anti-anti-sigma factor